MKRLSFRILLPVFGIGLPLLGILTGQVIIAGTLLSLALGGFMLVSGLQDTSQTSGDAKVLRGFFIAFGVFFLLAGLGLLVWTFNGAPIPGWREMRPIFSLEQFLLIAAFFGLNFFSQALKKFLDRRLVSRIQRRYPEGRIYTIPTYFTGVMILVLLLLVPVNLFLILGGLLGWLMGVAESSLPLDLGLGLPALLSPFLVFAILMIRHNSGAVVVDGKEVIRCRYLSCSSRQLDEIVKIRVSAFGFPTAVRLISPGAKLTFPTSINGYPELLQVLRTYTGLSVQKRRKKKQSDGRDAVQFPYTIGFSKARWVMEVISAGLLVVIYLGMALAGVWILLLRGDAPPVRGEDLLAASVIFILVSLIFGPFVLLVVKQTLKLENPTRMTFTHESVQVDYGHRKAITYPAADLEKVWLQPIKRRVRSSYGGARVVSSLQMHDLHLGFQGGEPLVLTRAKLNGWQTTPEELLAVLKELYPQV